MALTINTKTFNADAFGQNAVGYIGPLKSQSVKDDLSLRRTAAKGTATFSGVSRYLAKLTRTLALTSAKSPTWEAIVNLDVGIPVGAANADVDTICDDLASLIGSANFKTYLKTQKISF